MNFAGKFITTVAIVTGLGFAAQADQNVNVNTVLATVDGTNITIGHVIALRARLPQQYQNLPDDVLYDGLIEQLIQQTALMNAVKGNLSNQAEFGLENERRAFLASEMLDRITRREVSDDELKAAYEARYESAIPDQEFSASHILVETEETALEIIALLEDGADFATVAQERSIGPSGPNGGNLGWFGQGSMVAPFEKAVMALAVGEISPPVQTQFGWHVIKLDEVRNVEIPTLDDVRATLSEELRQSAVEDEVSRLTAAAEIIRPEVDVDPSIIRDVSLFDK